MQKPNKKQQMVNEDNPPDIYNEVGKENIEIIDIREEDELNQTNRKIVPGAKHIPYSELPKRIEEIDYEKDKIYVICRHGNSSVMACRLIESFEGSEGVYISSIRGGYIDWREELEDY